MPLEVCWLVRARPRRLVGAGVTAYCVVEPQLPHGHLRARNMSHRAKAAFDRIVEAIRDFASRAPQKPQPRTAWQRLSGFIGSIFGGRS